MSKATSNKQQATSNKQDSTDLLCVGQGNCLREGINCGNNNSCERLQGIRELPRKCRNHSGTIRRVINGKFCDTKDMYMVDIDKPIANTIVARYYKGIEGDYSNAVLVEYYE